MSIIEEAGILAISTRLQRMSEFIRKDGSKIYKANGIDFEPKWFPVVYILHKKRELSVVEIAAEIGYSHPSTISLLAELEKTKLVRSKRDRLDNRKRLIVLTKKGADLVERMQPVWKIITQAIHQLTNTTNNLMQALIEVEEQMSKKSFYERALDIQKKNSGM